jgi:hypothetical protein
MVVGDFCKLYGASWVCQKNESMLWVMCWEFHWGCYQSMVFFLFARFLRLLSKTYYYYYYYYYFGCGDIFGASCIKYEAILAMPWVFFGLNIVTCWGMVGRVVTYGGLFLEGSLLWVPYFLGNVLRVHVRMLLFMLLRQSRVHWWWVLIF